MELRVDGRKASSKSARSVCIAPGAFPTLAGVEIGKRRLLRPDRARNEQARRQESCANIHIGLTIFTESIRPNSVRYGGRFLPACEILINE